VSRANGRLDPISQSLQTMLTAGGAPIRSTLQWSSDLTEGVRNGPSLVRENRSLKDQLAATRLYVEQNSSLKDQVRELQGLLAIPPVPGRSWVGARVLAYSPHERRILISVGSRDGIKPMTPVVAGTGLVGIVSTVSAGTSQINLVISPQVQIGATIRRGLNPTGLLKGDGIASMVIEYLESASDIRVGDLVVTSGFSEMIPAGIPIGEVVNRNVDAQYGSRRALVAPFVLPGDVREVRVLR